MALYVEQGILCGPHLMVKVHRVICHVRSIVANSHLLLLLLLGSHLLLVEGRHYLHPRLRILGNVVSFIGALAVDVERQFPRFLSLLPPKCGS